MNNARNVSTLLTPRLISTAIRQSLGLSRRFSTKDIHQNPEVYAHNCGVRNYLAQKDNPFKIVKLFDQKRERQRTLRELRERRNVVGTLLSRTKAFSGDEVDSPETVDEEFESNDDLLEEARSLRLQISATDNEEFHFNYEIEALASELPNLTSPETLSLESEPWVVKYINAPPEQYPSPPSAWRDHVHLGTEFDLIDFSSAGTTSGWGWYYLKNEAARLERALVDYSISVALQHDFREVTPPSIVYSHITSACGFRPRDQNGEQQVYAIQQSEKAQRAGKPEHSLAGTAEIPFAALKADTVILETGLSCKIIGSSRCYRAEAGARGVATKGLYRVHEFTKVEMFGWTLPDKSEDLFHQMLSIQTEILANLGLYCRVLEMPASDLGASAYRKRDIEAYFPSRKERDEGWGEVTSTSMCTDYQSRRLATKVKTKEGKIDFPHTVNGTAMAVPRVLAALIENGWDEKEDVIRIPEVLWPWMHGCRVIRKKAG